MTFRVLTSAATKLKLEELHSFCIERKSALLLQYISEICHQDNKIDNEEAQVSPRNSLPKPTETHQQLKLCQQLP